MLCRGVHLCLSRESLSQCMRQAARQVRSSGRKGASSVTSLDPSWWPMAPGSMLDTKQRVLKKVESLKQGRDKIKVDPPPYKMKSQSILLPGPERIRVSGATDHPRTFVEHLDDTTRTVYPSKTGKYKWVSYAEVQERKDHIGSGLMTLGVKPYNRTMVGICTTTRPEFVLVLLACSRYSMVMVPLYNCSDVQTHTYIIDHVKMDTLFCESAEVAARFMDNSSEYPSLKRMVIFDAEEGDIAELKKNPKFTVLTLKDLESRGKLNKDIPYVRKPSPEDIFCICFTSGTTGTPKGVIVTHKNILSCISGIDTVLGDAKPKNKILMCYLPCAHIYEIINEVYCLYHGGRLGYYSGTTDNLLSDIMELKPTVLPLVPKLMNRIYDIANKKIGKNFMRRFLYNISVRQKERTLKKGIVSKTAIWDKFIFSKLQKQLGGSLQMIFTASAPVSKEVLQFFRCSTGCLVFEVYGLSEVGAAAMTLMSEHDCGFVGPPLPCNQIKLASVPEMSYYAEKDEGEICIRGLNVFSGYYNNHEATAEAIDSEGWYHTGDIGKWLPNGALAITDRKKHIFKIAQGEYIIPERVETAYHRSPLVSQIYVDGQSDKDFVIGILVPEEDAFVQWCREKGFKDAFDKLCENLDVKKALLKHLFVIGQEYNLNSLQQVGNIHITPEPFSQENDLLTPTLKLKRSLARKKFEDVFEKLYKEGNVRKAS